MFRAHVHAAYELATQTIRVTTWLEQDGEIVRTPTDARLRVYPWDSPTVASLDVTSSSPAAAVGHFQFEETLPLDPLKPAFVDVTLTASAVDHPSGAVLVLVG